MSATTERALLNGRDHHRLPVPNPGTALPGTRGHAELEAAQIQVVYLTPAGNLIRFYRRRDMPGFSYAVIITNAAGVQLKKDWSIGKSRRAAAYFAGKHDL